MSKALNDIMEVQLRWEERIAVLTINNPTRRNALSDPVNAARAPLGMSFIHVAIAFHCAEPWCFAGWGKCA